MRRSIGTAVLIAAALTVSTASGALAAGGKGHGNLNGHGGDMPAYYDDQLFTINFKLLKPDFHKNPSFNIIYQCDACADQGLNFVSVLDAIQGDGFNPIWEEQQITFNQGFEPMQFTSDDQILEAQQQGEITITDTEEFYRCSVVGHKK